MKTSVTVAARFSAAHFYHQPAWTDDENRRVFGRCFGDHGHGHDYRVEAEFENAAEAAIPALEDVLRRVTDPLDHRHLNFEIAEFRATIPTTENIAIYLAGKIAEARPPARLKKLKLNETPDLWVEVEP